MGVPTVQSRNVHRVLQAVYRRITRRGGLDLKRQQGPAALGFHTVFCSIDFATGKH